MKPAHLVLFALPLVACGMIKRKPVAEDAQAGPVEDSAPAEPAIKASPVVDPPTSKKKGDGVTVTFVSAASVKKGRVLLAFVIENERDTEFPVAGALSTQASTLSGVSGRMIDDPKYTALCSGDAPPHGRFACQVAYIFDETPPELRVRVEGAWFRVAVEQDAGAKP